MEPNKDKQESSDSEEGMKGVSERTLLPLLPPLEMQSGFGEARVCGGRRRDLLGYIATAGLGGRAGMFAFPNPVFLQHSTAPLTHALQPTYCATLG